MSNTKISNEFHLSFEEKVLSECNSNSDFSPTKSKNNQFTIEASLITSNSQKEPSKSCIESSELAIVKPPFRFGERLSTVILTSESVISRNRLQECSTYLERLCDHKTFIQDSKKFEEKVKLEAKLKLEEIPGLYIPIFTSKPTIAFCSRCGRDVKTKIQRVEPKIFGFQLSEFLFVYFRSF